MDQTIWSAFKDLCFTFYSESHVEAKSRFPSPTFFEVKVRRDHTKKLTGKGVYSVMLRSVWKDYSS